MLKVLSSNANSAGNRAFAGRGMSFQDSTVKPKQRSAAIGFRVHFPFDGAKGILRQQRPKLAMWAGGQFAFQHREDADGQTLTRFQNDVAHESIADHHFDFAFKKIVAFDIANEIDVKLLAKFEGLEGQFVAFRFLGTDAENSDSGIVVAKDLTGID